MNRSSWSNRTLIVLTLVLVAGVSISSVAETFRVCKIGCKYSSIERAVKDSESGDSIRVQNGNYTGNLRIDKPITIVGTNYQWVRMIPTNKDLPTISIGPSSTSVEIRNLTITGGGKNQGKAVSIKGNGELVLTNCRVENSEVGLQLENSSYTKLMGTEISNTSSGILALDSSEGVVHNGSIAGHELGIVVSNSSEVTIIGTDISNCGKNPILVKNTGKINLLSSRISDNGGPGIKLTDFSRLNMQDTRVSNNEGGGILLSNSAAANLTENQITYNEKKNLAIISKECGFSGPTKGFFGEVKGRGNEITPGGSEFICPMKFSRIESEEGGEYSYPFKPPTYAFIGLIGAATLLFFITR